MENAGKGVGVEDFGEHGSVNGDDRHADLFRMLLSKEFSGPSFGGRQQDTGGELGVFSSPSFEP